MKYVLKSSIMEIGSKREWQWILNIEGDTIYEDRTDDKDIVKKIDRSETMAKKYKKYNLGRGFCHR